MGLTFFDNRCVLQNLFTGAFMEVYVAILMLSGFCIVSGYFHTEEVLEKYIFWSY